MKKRELVAMLMESPFYFELLVRERLALVQQHLRRFSLNTTATKAGQFTGIQHLPTVRQPAGQGQTGQLSQREALMVPMGSCLAATWQKPLKPPEAHG